MSGFYVNNNKLAVYNKEEKPWKANNLFIIQARAYHQITHLATKALFRALVSHCGICGDKVALGQVSLPVLRFSPVNIITP
jgi:hypothetical protein